MNVKSASKPQRSVSMSACGG